MSDDNGTNFDDWRPTERRRGGYTIWKEIIGTAAVVVPIALAFAAWMTGIDKQTALNTLAITTLREQRVEFRERLDRMDEKLDRILTQTQQQVPPRGR